MYKLNVELVQQLAKQDGMSKAEIARRIQVPDRVIRKFMKRNDIKIVSPSNKSAAATKSFKLREGKKLHTTSMEKIDVDMVRTMAEEENMSMGKIATKFKVHRNAISRIMKQKGIKIQHPSNLRIAAVGRIVSKDLDEAEVRALAEEPDSSLPRLAKALQVPYHTIRSFVMSHGIKVKNQKVWRRNTTARISVASIVDQ